MAPIAPTAPQHLVRLEVAAERFDLSVKTIRRLIASGDLTGYRLGSSRMLRVDVAELDRLARPIPTACAS